LDEFVKFSTRYAMPLPTKSIAFVLDFMASAIYFPS